MSLYAALFSGVSGLKANSSALSVISDNITNVNTVGYKQSRTNFSTLVTETSSLSSYSAGGVRGVASTLVSGQGLLQASNSATDLGIDGNGFFVVKQTNDPADSAEGTIQFTRAGSFTPDEQGFLKNTAGLYLMGWKLDQTGNIPTNLGDTTQLEGITISGLTGTAEATANVKFRANLKSSEPVIAAYAVGDFQNDVQTPQFESSFQVFDSQGSPHTLTIAASKTAVNTWAVEVFGQPGEINGDAIVASGDLVFLSDGTPDLASSTFPFATASTPAPQTIDWEDTVNGSSDSLINFNIGDNGIANGFTQFDSVSTMISSNIDGAQFGNVTGVAVGKDGIITALFNNGLTKAVYKLPIATFQNANGLTRLQGNAYGVSDQSGNFSMVEPGTGGGGLISPTTLEASTVDLAAEFSDMITTQRAFSAATKVITTADQMLDELNNIKR